MLNKLIFHIRNNIYHYRIRSKIYVFERKYM